MNTIPPRYQGNELLRVLELYVLHQIGQLPQDQGDYMRSKAGELRKAYKRNGEWHEVIASAMRFPPGFDEHIREKWRLNGSTLTPEKFAQEFVDANVDHQPPSE